jgi:hypothetical protein
MFRLTGSLSRLFKVALLGGVAFGSVMGISNPAKAFLPVLSLSNPKGGFTNDPPTSYSGQSSFGYYFDLNGSTVIDALGLWAQQTPPWTTGDYTVTLWQYDAVDPLNLQPSEISEVPSASVTFTEAEANANLYPVQGGYFWKPIPLTTLTGTPGDPRKGYILGVVGTFTSPGQLATITTPVGDQTYNYGFINEGNGYNFATDLTGFYPVPVFLAEYDDDNDPTTPDVPVNGYFNPNLSVVPGPLPVLGAAAGFGWTRRLRKRIRASK